VRLDLRRLRALFPILLLVGVQNCAVFAGDLPAHDFVITSQRAALQIYPDANAIACVDTLTIRPIAKNLHSIGLSFLPIYKIDYLQRDGNKTDYRQSHDTLLVSDTPDDREFQITISYYGIFNFESDFAGISEKEAVLHEKAAFPGGTQRLTFSRVAITVPKSWRAEAAGRLVAQRSSADSATFVWEESLPLSSSGWICAGEWRTEQHVDGNPPITVYRAADDTVKSTDLATLVQKIVGFYGKEFLPYRFPKLDIVEVGDWVAGRAVLAVASPSMILVKRMAFETDDQFNRVENVLPHEIAHQWWPLTVYADEADAALLSEGLCEYSARLFNESRGTLSVRDTLDHHPLLRPLLVDAMNGTDVPLHQDVDLRSVQTHYVKGSYVHHMLRNLLGNSVYIRVLQAYALNYQNKETDGAVFEQLAEKVSGKRLGWFFDEWTNTTKIPRLKLYNVHARQDSAGWKTNGRVRIVGYDQFTTFADVGVMSGNDTVLQRIWLGNTNVMESADSGEYRNDAGFSTHTTGKPVRAVLDPGGNTLKLLNLPARFSDLRQPGSGLMIVGTLNEADHLLSIARHDSAGMARVGWRMTIVDDTSVTLASLQRQTVLLYGSPKDNSQLSQLQQKFPYSFRGDSVVVNNESVFDSSLALLQAIENPFQPHGLMIWIAPLSERAFPELQPYDASWVVLRGKEEISSGVFPADNEDTEVTIKE